MSRTKSYLAKLNIAISMFKEGTQPVEISKILNMDIGCLRDNLRVYGYTDNNVNHDIHSNIFHHIDNEEKAYWLGFLYADGCVSKDSNRISLTLKDKNHVLKFKEFIGIKKDIRIKNVKENDYYDITFRNKQMHTDLIKNGCIPNKSLILKYPKHIPANLERHFIRGYFDGDGCLHKYDYEHYMIFSITSTLDVLIGIMVACELPLRQFSRDGKAYTYKCAEKYYVNKFLDYIYKDANVYLDRKFSIYMNCRLD